MAARIGSPVQASKIAAERLTQAQRGSIPVVFLRPAGIYEDQSCNVFLAQQTARIYERDAKGMFIQAICGQANPPASGRSCRRRLRLVDRRHSMPPEVPILHGEDWETWELPKPLAKVGARVETDILRGEPFIRSWMVDIADDHYDLDLSRARQCLDWAPKRALRTTLPAIISSLKSYPAGWYRDNKLDDAKVAGWGNQARLPWWSIPSTARRCDATLPA